MYKRGPYKQYDKQSEYWNRFVYGVGINDADYTVSKHVRGLGGKEVWRCPYYTRWNGILRRCYDEKYHIRQPHYKGCSICEEWKTFSNFKRWMEQQDWEDKHIDKDILVPGNREYGPTTCLFVSKDLNNLILENHTKEKKYSTGVEETKEGRFKVQVNQHAGKTYLGCYDTIEEALEVHNKAKSEYIIEVANGLTTEDTSDVERTREALIRHAGILVEQNV